MHHAWSYNDHKQPRQYHGQACHDAFGFVTWSSAGSTEAALNLTQPTVSKTIQALEEELSVPLLVKENGRKKRQVATTPIGETIQTACRSQGFTPNVVCRTGQWDMLADMVGHRPSARILRPQNQPRHLRRRPADRPRNPLATDHGVEETPASHPLAQGLAGHRAGRIQEIEKGRLKIIFRRPFYQL